MNKIKLKIINPQGVFFDQNVDIVTAKTLTGYIGILHGHQPLISSLVPSRLSYRIDGIKKIIHISGGIIEANKEIVKIITDNVETDEDRMQRLHPQ